MSSKIELLPCPHCGKDQTNFHHYSKRIGFDVFYCIRCYCCAETIGRTPEEAAACWNSRTAPPELAELQATIARLTAENERLRESDKEGTELCDTLSSLLGQIAIAVRGPEETKTRHGFSDLPSRVKTVVSEIERLKGGQGEPVLWFKRLTGAECKSDGRTYDVMFCEIPGYAPLFASQPAPVSTPDGWKLVPLNPTSSMLEAGKDERMDCFTNHNLSVEGALIRIYSAIIEAAPACLDKVKELNYQWHASDCSTNNRGVPELLGPCDCHLSKKSP